MCMQNLETTGTCIKIPMQIITNHLQNLPHRQYDKIKPKLGSVFHVSKQCKLPKRYIISDGSAHGLPLENLLKMRIRHIPVDSRVKLQTTCKPKALVMYNQALVRKRKGR